MRISSFSALVPNAIFSQRAKQCTVATPQGKLTVTAKGSGNYELLFENGRKLQGYVDRSRPKTAEQLERYARLSADLIARIDEHSPKWREIRLQNKQILVDGKALNYAHIEELRRLAHALGDLRVKQ